MHVLELDSVQYAIKGRTILSDIYLQCQTGKITALTGRNGSGKSSLMKIIFGTLNAEHNLRLDGNRHAGNRSPALLHYLPQAGLLPASCSVKQVFEDFGVGFDEFYGHFPEFAETYTQRASRLAKGQQRIIETYLVIKSQSLFSLLDEPFTYVMPLHVSELQNILSAEKQRKGFLIADHRHDMLLPIADRVYVLSEGFLKERKDF